MATHSATDLLSRPRHMAEYGDGILIPGDVVPAAGGNGDIIRTCIIPAGVEVSLIALANGDLDINGAPTIAFSMGYTPVNPNDGALAADDGYFVAAGDTSLQAAQGGKVYANFAPIKFEQDVFLDITLTAVAATFAAAAVRTRVHGRAVGVK